MDVDRRVVMGVGVMIGSVTAGLRSDRLSAEPRRTLFPPRLEFAFQAIVAIGTPIELGRIGGQRKRIVPITGGSFAGPTLRGYILPGGGDWQAIRDDGTAEILARYTLQTDDGTVISIVNPGYRHGPSEVLARIARGDDVDPALYYFRTSPQFVVADTSPHAWLGKNVFVSTAARYATEVIVDVYLLL